MIIKIHEKKKREDERCSFIFIYIYYNGDRPAASERVKYPVKRWKIEAENSSIGCCRHIEVLATSRLMSVVSMCGSCVLCVSVVLSRAVEIELRSQNQKNKTENNTTRTTTTTTAAATAATATRRIDVGISNEIRISSSLFVQICTGHSPSRWIGQNLMSRIKRNETRRSIQW